MTDHPRRRHFETKFYPADPDQLQDHERKYRKRGIPSNMYEATMQAAPHEEIAESSDEKQIKLEGLRDALETGVLLPEEQWLLEAIFWRGLSLEAAGRELGISQSTAHRWRDTAIKKLRVALADPEREELG